jgi:hypothetical protein
VRLVEFPGDAGVLLRGGGEGVPRSPILHTFGRLSTEHVCASIYGCYGGRDELYDLVVLESLSEENRKVRDERGEHNYLSGGGGGGWRHGCHSGGVGG